MSTETETDELPEPDPEGRRVRIVEDAKVLAGDHPDVVGLARMETAVVEQRLAPGSKLASNS